MGGSFGSQENVNLLLPENMVEELGATFGRGCEVGCCKARKWFGDGVRPIYIPSGKLSHNYGKSPFYSWENPLVMLVYQRVFGVFGVLPWDFPLETTNHQGVRGEAAVSGGSCPNGLA